MMTMTMKTIQKMMVRISKFQRERKNPVLEKELQLPAKMTRLMMIETLSYFKLCPCKGDLVGRCLS